MTSRAGEAGQGKPTKISEAAAEAGALVRATLEHATGGVVIAFAEVLDDA